MKLGLTGCTKMLITNHQSTMHNIPEVKTSMTLQQKPVIRQY